MEDFNYNDKEVFYLSLILQEKGGTISAIDSIALADWRALNEENNELYNKTIEVEDDLSLLEIYRSLNVEDSLATLHKKLKVTQQSVSKNQSRVMIMNWVALAACLVVVFIGILYFNLKSDTIIIETNSKETKTLILPDGSKLTLNRESSVTFSKKDFNNERVLNLVKGECFFEVIHNEKKPFTVRYEGLQIKDIGTSFNVKLTDNNVGVIVNKGKVQMATENQLNLTYLNAGESAIFSFDNGSIKKAKLFDINYKAYVDHNFYFIDTSLADVIVALSNGFHKKIILSNPIIKNRRLTAEFKNQKLDDILLVISKSLNVKTSVKQSIIYISE